MNTKENYPPEYWDKFFEKNHLGWDIGYVSTPLKEYFDQLEDKSIKILVPGSGRGWEVEYLYKSGFLNVVYHDFSSLAHEAFLKRVPGFPQGQMLRADFFSLRGSYDLVVEQTFFSALPRSRRKDYARQMYDLLKPGGKLAGLLFTHEFVHDSPPFGGSLEEYKRLFFRMFTVRTFEVAYNSIQPRKEREFFIILEKTAG
jgi:thiopurine S-methyltransferase